MKLEKNFRLGKAGLLRLSVGKHILVDPAVKGEELLQVLDERCGLKPEDVDYVYVTHWHGDHDVGMTELPNAVWYAVPQDAERIRRELPAYADRIFAPGKELLPGIQILPLPGHTMGLAGLLFESKGGVVAVAGDSVMTGDFFKDRIGYYNNEDPEVSVQSILLLAEKADIVVPGHGNYFLTHRASK